jgi:hypothetical protein
LYSEKGDFYNDSRCHRLQYFSKNAESFVGYGSYWPGGPDTVASERIGAINGFTIYDVIHNVGDMWFMKMILVERTRGEFCEIFQQEYERSILTTMPAYIITVDSENVLVTEDPVMGVGGLSLRAYWTFDKQGPIILDFGEIDEAINDFLPDGYYVEEGDYSGFNIGALTYEAPVWKGEEGSDNCCPLGGHIYVEFGFRNHQLSPIDTKFEKY